MSGDSSITNAAFADALNRARQLAAKIGSGEKRPLEDGAGNIAKRPNNDENSIVASMSPGGMIPSATDPVIVEVIQVPDSMVGLIIGRGGEQITSIQAQSQCRVQMAQDSGGMPERQCTLTGTKHAIEEAKELIGMIVSKNAGANIPGRSDALALRGGQTVEEMLIPGQKVGLVIGKGGENLKRIQEELEVRMIVIQDTNTATIHDKPLRIIGEADKVAVARQRVIDVMNSKDDSVHGFGDFSGAGQRSIGEVIVPRIAVGTIIGKGGEMIKKIQNETGSRVQFKLAEDPNGPERTAVLTGTPDQIQKATGMITELVNQAVMKQTGGPMPMSVGLGSSSSGGDKQELFYMHVPANKTGLVIGKGGETIRQINVESGAHVELSRDPPPNDLEKIFIIKGTAAAIHNAQHLIRIKVGDIPAGTPVPPFQQNGAGLGVSAPAPSAVPRPAGFGGVPHQLASSQPNPVLSYASPLPAASVAPASAQDQSAAAAWAAYYAQYYQQAAAAGGYPAAAQPQQTQAAQPQPTPTPSAISQPQPTPTQSAPAVNPLTGQPDYSAQWAEYYRSLGMHEQAALIEQQAKATQAAAAAAQVAGVGAPTGVQPQPQAQPQSQPSSTYAAYPQQTGYPGIAPQQQAYQQPF